MRNRNSACLLRPKISRITLGFVFFSLWPIGGCGGGSPSVPPPSGLVYPQSSIKAVVGTAIQSDTPTVSGTVTGYAVSPALPAGLGLSPSNGTISGTPTAVVSSANYAVTATNSTGATTTTIQVAVAPAAPSNLVYPKTTITALVNSAFIPDQPTVTGTVTGYTTSPAFPAGLALDPVNGIVSGTPTAAAAAATYTITAANSTGSTTASIQITVWASPQVLQELGHATTVSALRTAGDAVLSEDVSGHWVLWNYTSGQIVTSGDGGSGQIDLAGQVAVIGTASSIQILSATDGSVMGSIPSAAWWLLATDGSYLCTGSTTALTIWSTAGMQESTHAGDYHAAVAFAAPAHVQVALGAAGSSVIETISVPSATSSVSPQFLGTFSSWFTDGQRFLTANSNSNQVWTYSHAGVQQAAVTLPSVNGITGQGNWIWTLPSDLVGPLQVYAVGATTPTSSFAVSWDPNLPPTASGLFMGNVGGSEIDVVDLSGTTPTLTKYNAPTDAIGGPPYASAFAASSATQWVGSYSTGEIFDGASLSATPRYFGYGAIQGIAATPNLVALSTSTGKILLLDPTGATAPASIDFWAGPVALSTDGTVLAADSGWAATSSVNELNFYSLPSQKTIATFPGASGFTMSASGNAFGSVADTYTRSVSDLTDKVIWSDSGSVAPLSLSPDGTLIAAPNFTPDSVTGCAPPATNLYKNGTLVATLPAYAEGWIDNDHLLTSNWTTTHLCLGLGYNGSTIYSSTGAVVATISQTADLEGITSGLQFPTTDTVFSPEPGYFLSGSVPDKPANTLYSLTTGAALWTVPDKSAGACAVSGSLVACQVGHQVLLYPY
jgi:hypothetical protein